MTWSRSALSSHFSVAEGALAASLSLGRGASGQVGARRIALLQAIVETGSIQAAAVQSGLSYKGAWDAVQALNNLFERPLVLAKSGGQGGGAAEVTADGRAVMAAFAHAEDQAARSLGHLQTRLAGGDTAALLWRLSLRTSVRNALQGVVTHLALSGINAEVVLDIGQGQTITAVVTRGSVAELDLAIGHPAIALIKSSFITLAADDGLRTSARTCLRGVVTRRDDGLVNCEITTALDGGKTLTAVITLASAEAMELAAGQSVVALIKASHVILAVE